MSHPKLTQTKLTKICIDVLQNLGFIPFDSHTHLELIGPSGLVFELEPYPQGVRLKTHLEVPRKNHRGFLTFLNQFNHLEGQKAWLNPEERRFYLQLDLFHTDGDALHIRQRLSHFLWQIAGFHAGGPFSEKDRSLPPRVKEQLCESCIEVINAASFLRRHRLAVEEAEEEMLTDEKKQSHPPGDEFWENLPPF